MFNLFNLAWPLNQTYEAPEGILDADLYASEERTVKVVVTKTKSTTVRIETVDYTMSRDENETDTIELELPLDAVVSEEVDEDDEDEDGVWTFNVTFKKVPHLVELIYASAYGLAKKYGFDYGVVDNNDESVTFRFSSPDYDVLESVAKGFFVGPDGIYRYTV